MQPERLVAGRFELESLAETGGMGSVYRAFDRQTSTRVALKVMSGVGEPTRQRFVVEARTLAELRHPAIVQYVAHGTTPSGECYIAMEWLDGVDLGTRLRDGPLTVAQTVGLGRRLAEALGVAHARGIVHRDIKPGNLFLPGGRLESAKVLDFGVARRADDTRHETGTGLVIGTLGYMAPEQARSGPSIDARADVFALGAVLYECLSGAPAFAADEPLALLAKLLLVDAPRVSDLRPEVPDELASMIARMLAKDPDTRPKDCGTVARALGGEHVLESLVPPRRPSLTPQERRLLSVVIAGGSRDVGAATVTDDDAHARYHDLDAIVEKHGARAEHLVDGSILISIRGTEATDQASRAAHCALALRRLFPEHRMAVVTGRGVVEGSLPVGEVLDRAVRLVKARATDGVRLDEVTAGLLPARFEVAGDAAGLVLRGERDVAAAPRTLLGRPTTCIGRNKELRILEAIVEDCFEESSAQVVLLTGPGGIGKSRIRYELTRERARQVPRCQLWIGRADPMRAGSPFGLVAQALRGVCGLREGEPLGVRQRKLHARVGRNVRPSEHERVTQFLGEMLGVPFSDRDSVQLRTARQDPMLMGDQIQLAWESFVEAECKEGPILLVLEDLHWGDVPTVKLVDGALRNLSELPLMVLALARPEVHDLFPDLWQDRGVQELRIHELTRKASARMVQDALGEHTPPETVARLVDRAAGNAFYLEELIRAEAEGQASAGPGTVVAMVQGRLESMEHEARRVLRGASVFGEVFWRGGLVALLGEGSEHVADEWLEALEGREVLSQRAESRFPGDAEYIFRHGLVREAAYAMLTDEDRVLGHGLAAEWLEAAGELDAVLLAEHLERAGERTRAVGFYARAAEQALEAGDLAAVHQRAEGGIACQASGNALAALHMLQARAYRWTANHPDALDCAFRAMALYPKGSPEWHDALGLAVNQAVLGGEHDRIAPVLEELQRLTAEAPTDGAWVKAAAIAAARLLLVGRMEAAAPLVAALDAFQPEDWEPAVEANVHRCQAIRHMGLGGTGRSLESWHLSVAAFERAGDIRSACVQRINLGEMYLELGAYEEAEQIVREALAASDRLGLDLAVAMAKQQLGRILAGGGKLEEAREVEAASVKEMETLKTTRMEGMSRNYLAQILLEMGDAEQAEAEATRAVEILVDPPAKAHALGALARIHLARHRADAALAAARQAMSILDELGSLNEGESLVRLIWAEALEATGDREGARRAIEAAHERILARAGQIADSEWQRTFLEGVGDNARVRALAERWAPAAP